MKHSSNIGEKSLPLEIDARLRERLAEAVLAQSGSRHEALNAFLRERLAGSRRNAGALLSEPVIEGAAAYRSSGLTPSMLSGDLLHPNVVEALTTSAHQRPDEEDYRFLHSAYEHQLESWKLLTDEKPKSVLVSSGTGSGKTECFMVPLLHDLAKEAADEGRLSGVRAIMLYPLNALIASQQERLRQWTRPFKGDIRFALYNGLMGHKRQHVRQQDAVETPEQVQDRDTLRKDPPPILVTNNTMLEYMTIRQEDRPIIEKSYGKLRWIIIDEAHSYVGSAAAEVSLLLRRVMQTFGVEPSQVRFVATSATIGGVDSDADPAAKEAATLELQKYLADLAGVPLDQVHVVVGGRESVALPPADMERVRLDENDLPVDLARNNAVQQFIRAIEKRPLSLSDADRYASLAGLEVEQLLRGLAQVPEGEQKPLLPMRVHKFVRAVPGLWGCINSDCGGAKPREWPYGAVLFDKQEHCPHCQSLVLELINCNECGEGWLKTHDESGRLTPARSERRGDDFADFSDMSSGSFETDEDNSAEREETQQRAYRERLVGLRPFARCREDFIDPATGVLSERRGEGVKLWLSEETVNDECPCCGVGKRENSPSPLRSFRFGAPFILQNATPTILEGVTPHAGKDTLLPGEGRQVLSFTDSRQGTARFAANIETQSERGFVRSYLYHMVQKALGSAGQPSGELAELDRQIAELELIAPGNAVIQGLVEDLKLKRANLLAPKPVEWEAAVNTLAADPTIAQWFTQVWKDRDPRFKDPKKLAHFLMLRELVRRPRKANALETMGLVRLRFDEIEKITEAGLPSEFRQRGLSVTDWQDFLYYLLDVAVRNVFVLRIDKEDARWILPKQNFLRHIMPPGHELDRHFDRPWPLASSRPGVRSNLVLLLERALATDVSNPEHRAEINDVLRKAWDALSGLLGGLGNTYALDIRKTSLEAVTEGWVCPITNRILPRLTLGVSPYGLRSSREGALAALPKVEMPKLPLVFPKHDHERQQIADFLAGDPAVAKLSELGVWSGLQTRAAMFVPFIRAEEHSAQQPAYQLREFEREFKEHKINLLACSTTMEMGVDIGSVESVLNTNVPPSIANYRQRVGRAGRRGQAFSTSLTFARDVPLDREAFREPAAYLQKQMRAPMVKLDSVRIVQRHVNAMLLAKWFAVFDGQLIKAKVGDFYGCPPEKGATKNPNAPAQEFVSWLKDPSTRSACDDAVKRLVKGTVLQGRSDLFDITANGFSDAFRAFLTTWEYLRAQRLDATPEAQVSIDMRLKRVCGESLLKELANQSLLPGHGFPTAVVPFVNDCAETVRKFKDADKEPDERANNARYDYPSRNADVAIREYAPGAEVVIDGLVWTSAGVTLNWNRPANDIEANEVQSLRYFWRCTRCKCVGAGHVAPKVCAECGEEALVSRRYFEPSGFRVAWNEEPHASTDTADYIEPEKPVVSAAGAPWQPLLSRSFGQYRATHDGSVFHFSNGKSKQGYRICLECGFASDDPVKLSEHHALTPRKGASGHCPGNERSYAITEPMSLGHQIVTDVAEVQPAALGDESTAWAVASALRGALAEELAIETRELGVFVERATGVLGERTHSIFIYDNASGGAGYSPQLFHDFERLIAKAAKRLDCPVACEHGCSACVMTNDIAYATTVLNRRQALDFVRGLASAWLDLDKEDMVGAGNRRSMPVADVLVRKMRPDHQITIFASEMDTAELYKPPVATLLEHAQRIGATVRLAIPKDEFAEMDSAVLIGLRNASHRYSFKLVKGAPLRALNGARMLAHLSSPKNSDQGFYSREQSAAQIGDTWGVGLDHPVVTVEKNCPALEAVSDEELEIGKSSGTDFVLMSAGLTVTHADFGRVFIDDYLQPKLSALGMWQPGALKRITYTDRYLMAPLPTILLFRTIDALADRLGDKELSLPVVLNTNYLRLDTKPGSKIYNNWTDEGCRDAIISSLSEFTSCEVELKKGMQKHSRKMTLDYGDRGQVDLFFDQGFGCWQNGRDSWFDFADAPDVQAENMWRRRGQVALHNETYLAFVVSRA